MYQEILLMVENKNITKIKMLTNLTIIISTYNVRNHLQKLNRNVFYFTLCHVILEIKIRTILSTLLSGGENKLFKIIQIKNPGNLVCVFN